MKCDNGKISDIISEINRIYQDLTEVKIQLEEKIKKLSLLTSKHIETNIKNVNYTQEDSIMKIKNLIAQIEASVAAIMAMNEMDLTYDKKISIPKKVELNPRFSFEFNTIKEEDALKAIKKNITKSNQITNIINMEISSQLKDIQK